MGEIEKAQRVALFADGDNLTSSYAPRMASFARGLGRLAIGRVYADVTKYPGWQEASVANGLAVRHVANCRPKKNVTDIALMLDAMETLCADRTDVFVIATDDSDYAQLAMRIRERGKAVVGLGTQRAPDDLRMACTEFADLEEIRPERSHAETSLRERVLDTVVIYVADQQRNEGQGPLTASLAQLVYATFPKFPRPQPTFTAFLMEDGLFATTTNGPNRVWLTEKGRDRATGLGHEPE